MKKTLYILTFILLTTSVYSQKEYHNWYFGDSAGVTFNTPDEEPIYLDGNGSNYVMRSSFNGTSIISDSEGNLKFYFRNGRFFTNLRELYYGNNIFAALPPPQTNANMTQGSIMLNIGQNTFMMIYNPSRDAVYYSIFEEDLDNDSITVLKNERILRNYESDNLLAIRDFNSNSFYLLLHNKFNNNNRLGEYILFKFDIDSYEFNEIQRVDSKFVTPRISHIGTLKSSLNGKYIASFAFGLGIELLEFNNEEIKVIESLEFNTDRNDAFWGEFSPSGEYLYFSQYKPTDTNRKLNYITGFESKDFKINEIEYFDETSSLSLTMFLLGPNRKIYTNFDSHLSTISDPDNVNDIKFIENDVPLPNNTLAGMPIIPTTFYNLLFVTDSINVCLGQTVQFTSELYAPFTDTIYSWSGPNGFTSNLPNPTIEEITANKSGVYTLNAFNSDSSVSYQRKTHVTILPDPIPEITIEPDTNVCLIDKAELSVPLEYNDFEWTTGETTHTISVDETGVYGVTYTNENGCTGYAEVNITFEEDMTIDILGETVFCEGSSTTLSADQDYNTYLWSNGDDTKTTLISEAGRYWLEVTTAEGCTISDTIDISYHPEITAELKPVSTTICEGDSVLLESVNDVPYYSYEWNTGATTRGIYVKISDTYKLTITDTRTGCMDSTEISIRVEDNLQPTIIGTNICEGETATLEALPNDPSYSYEWSNGETTPTIQVTQPATYSVIVSKDGCTGTADFTVDESPNPELEILGEDIVCGNTATLSCSENFEEYLWSTNEVTKEIEVTEAGTYSLTVTDEKGCQATEEFTVTEQSLSFNIIGGDIFCGSSTTLSPDKNFAEYLWSTNEITKEIEVTEAGTYTLTVTDENGCIATEEFTVKEQSLSFDISKDRIDFGKIYISETAIDSATIINTSGIDIELSDGQIVGDGMPIIFKETLDPTELGPYADSFEYRVIEPCDTVITIPVTAEVYAIATISSDNIETEIGKEESISVYLKSEADLGEQTYSITTDLDQSVLFTNDNFAFTNTAPINETKTKVHEINGTIMLASSLEYDITFPSYEFNNPYIEVATEQGSITIDSVCAFPLRAVTFIESTEMRVSPNPAKDKLVVDVHSEENTIMTLELISSEGRVAYTENWTQKGSNKQLNINTDKIPSGLYQVRLQTPSGVLTENVIVVR